MRHPEDAQQKKLPGPECELSFVRLPEVPSSELLAHMSEPRVVEHMPLLTSNWDHVRVAEFVAAKEERWQRDGLGHWAILCDGVYIGWGGFQKEGDDWDFGLVLKPDRFGLGPHIARRAIAFAAANQQIPAVSFLLPPSRTKLGWLARIGATFVGVVEYDGAPFLKFRVVTE